MITAGGVRDTGTVEHLTEPIGEALDRAEGVNISNRLVPTSSQTGFHLVHLPPSTLSTWPVIQPACSDAKNNTA
jgi:hypothetical protein